MQNLYLKRNLLGEEREDNERKHFAKMMYNTTKCSLTKPSFLARYERVSRRNLPSNVRIRRTRTIGPKNRRTKKKRATFADTATEKTARRIIKKYRNQQRKKAKKGGTLLGNIAKWGVNMGAKILFK